MEDPNPADKESSPRSSTPAIAITAIVLSLAALTVSVLEVSAIRSEQRTQVWPYVELGATYNSEGFTLLATNKGIGPARVRSLTIEYKGQPYTDLDRLILDTVGEENAFSYDVYRSSNPARSVMSPGESTTIFAVPWEPRTRLLVDSWGSDINIELCFCSVYDECWVSVFAGDEPMPVEQCTQ